MLAELPVRVLPEVTRLVALVARGTNSLLLDERVVQQGVSLVGGFAIGELLSRRARYALRIREELTYPQCGTSFSELTEYPEMYIRPYTEEGHLCAPAARQTCRIAGMLAGCRARETHADAAGTSLAHASTRYPTPNCHHHA